MKNAIRIALLVLFTLSVPFQAFAFECTGATTPEDFTGFICLGIDYVGTAIPIVMSLAVLAFFWGLAKFILNAGSEEARDEGKNVMKWGIVALFVLVSVWGIVAFISNDILGFTPSGYPLLPEE